MVKTHGLTHLTLAVRDPERSLRFYGQVLGVVEVFREPGFFQAQTPGSRDVLVLAAREVELAGGKVLSQGEFCPGEPSLFARDPDGYEIEIWFELPTPVDPRPGK